ncbi:MAG: DNA topoisomerase [Phycisphaeraceae bacterium]
MAKRKTSSRTPSAHPPATASGGNGKHLVIVESPTKAKTINKYLGRDYLVMASVGHVRDLPARASTRDKVVQLKPGGTGDFRVDEPVRQLLGDGHSVAGHVVNWNHQDRTLDVRVKAESDEPNFLPTKGKAKELIGEKSGAVFPIQTSTKKEQPVPGVDLEHGFRPTYEVMPKKEKTIAGLKKAARTAADIWFATDLDREGEAIAWHLAQTLDVPIAQAKRVVFNAITKTEISHAFKHPRLIDEAKVNAQQARRILDRIVGYQVSPLLWKKVAGGLSAGRVQSVATRLVVEREREIEGFVPDEEWTIAGYFALSEVDARKLEPAWAKYIAGRDEKNNPPTVKAQNAWLSEARAIRAELVEFAGEKFEPAIRVDKIIGPLTVLSPDSIRDRLKKAAAAFADPDAHDLTANVAKAAQACGLREVRIAESEDPEGRGPARWRRTVEGMTDPATSYRVRSILTKRVSNRPPAPFITSTMQQQAANQLGFALQRAMRTAQQLYEGIDLGGSLGQTGLITYMRTDSTHLSGEALNMVRGYIGEKFGDRYLPGKPNFFASSNQAAQEAHEAIRPTDVSLTPSSIRNRLSDEQFKLYDLIWRRFVACQMANAEWDATSVLIDTTLVGSGELEQGAVFKANGRVLIFDGYLKVAGIPAGDEAILPSLKEQQPVAPLRIDPTQRFTSPPPRYSEASLQKKLEKEGIGRPSTYAAIISTIQDRKYVQTVLPRDRRLMATDLGKVVTDKLIDAFPEIMDVAYTRQMEDELDKIEAERHDWVKMLQDFYGPFKDRLERAYEEMTHAKAETEPAPFTCPECAAGTMYRFGKNGRFLSCSRYPECKYAAPIDHQGQPVGAEYTDIICPVDGSRLIKRTGRFGPFLSSENYPEVKFILNLDPRKGGVKLPKVPPLLTELPCPKCGAPLNLRRSKRGPWLSCSKFPKCRGREVWTKIDEKKQTELEKALAAHEAANPVAEIRTAEGRVVEEGYIPQVTAAASDQPIPAALPALDADAA